MREARLSICGAYKTGGSAASLAALAGASIRLYFHVEAGSLIGEVAEKMLRDVADNLGLCRLFGERVVDVAINAGPALYDTFDETLLSNQPKARAAA